MRRALCVTLASVFALSVPSVAMAQQRLIAQVFPIPNEVAVSDFQTSTPAQAVKNIDETFTVPVGALKILTTARADYGRLSAVVSGNVLASPCCPGGVRAFSYASWE